MDDYSLSALELNRANLKYNIEHFRSLVADRTKMLVLVKANAYGHGAVEIARELEALGVDYLGVALACEGTELRKAGIKLPILVFTTGEDAFDEIVDSALEPALADLESVKSFESHVRRRGLDSYPIHLPVDTGMHRVGFMERDLDELEGWLRESDGTLRIQSAYSHLVGSDEERFDDFTLKQIALFEKAYDRITAITGSRPLKHILNTGGIERFGQYSFDMVRLGIGTYGIKLFPEQDIRPVASLKAKIIQIKHLDKDDGTVGYSRRGAITGPCTIATVPLGYADGIDRRLSCGNARFLVKGKLVPTIGNVCMDVLMIDVTGTGASVGDEVTVFGESPRIEQIADILGTIPYEVATSVPRRVVRRIR